MMIQNLGSSDPSGKRQSGAQVRFVITGYPPSLGGAQLHTQMLAEHLAETKLATEVVCLWLETRTDFLWGTTLRLRVGSIPLTGREIPIIQVGLTSPANLADLVVTLTYFVRRASSAGYFARRLDYPDDEPELVHLVRMGREHLYLRALQESKLSGTPVVLTPNHHPRWSMGADKVWRSVYRSADHLFALTSHEADMLQDLGIGSDKVTVTGIGPILSRHPTPLAELGREFQLQQPYLVYVGQQYSYKRLDVVIAVFDYVASHQKDLRLAIVGPLVPATSRLIAKSKHAERIQVLGPVSLQHKTTLIREAALLLLPSEQEAFGGVLIEAATTGTPFIASNIPALKEVTSLIGGGISLPISVSQMAEATLALVRSELEVPVKKSELERFSWPSLARIYRDSYQRVVDH